MEDNKHWTAKDYAEFWKQQIGKTFEYRQKAYTKSNEVSKSITITGVEYEGGNRVYLHCIQTFESGKTREGIATEEYTPTSEGTLYEKLILKQYCYVNYPYYFRIPLEQAKKKDGTLKRRTVFKPWGTHCTIY